MSCITLIHLVLVRQCTWAFLQRIDIPAEKLNLFVAEQLISQNEFSSPNIISSGIMTRWSLLLSVAFLLLLLFIAYGEQAQQLQKSKMRRQKYVNPRSTLECHRREYTFKAVNTDEASGKKCTGYITVDSCWGRCNSGEIADYHFPFKKSFHYMCMHGESKKSMFELADCEPGAPRFLRYYEALVAKSCVCRHCETSQTNCEGFPDVYS